MSNLKTNDEIVKLLWPNIRETMIYMIKEGRDTNDGVFRTIDYNGILEIVRDNDSQIIPIDCYGSDNDGNEFELSDQHLDQLHGEMEDEGYYSVVDSYDYDDDNQDWYK